MESSASFSACTAVTFSSPRTQVLGVGAISGVVASAQPSSQSRQLRDANHNPAAAIAPPDTRNPLFPFTELRDHRPSKTPVM